MGNLYEYARDELERAGMLNEDSDYDGQLGQDVLEIIKTFEKQGHSGWSAVSAIKLFSQVASWEPLTPLTGEDNEWNMVADGHFQNRRCSRVFKEVSLGETKAYDIRGKVFRTPDNTTYICRDSKVEITFPYYPTTEYVDVDE